MQAIFLWCAAHQSFEVLAEVILEIPPHFERDMKRGEQPQVLIAANAVNGTKGSMGNAYLSSIVSQHMMEVAKGSASIGMPTVSSTRCTILSMPFVPSSSVAAILVVWLIRRWHFLS